MLEFFNGRWRTAVTQELFQLTCDKSGHDGGDECRYWAADHPHATKPVRQIVNHDEGDQ
jgi:hypothetical protein